MCANVAMLYKSNYGISVNIQWVPKVSVRLRGAVRKTRFSKRSHKLNSRWNAIKFFCKVKIRVGFHLIFFGNFQQRDMWFLSRCESIRTAERPSREMGLLWRPLIR